MCSFLFITSTAKDFSVRSESVHTLRGPDTTETISINGRKIIHNLLSLNGSLTAQPIYSNNKDCVIFFNGELYNQEVFSEYNGNDTLFLLSLIEDHESIHDAIRSLDGEFVICIYFVGSDTITIATDLFRTKPASIGYSPEEDLWSISTYASGSDTLINPVVSDVPENRLIEIDLSANRIVKNVPLHDYRAIASETTFAQWTDAFDAAILKRRPQTGKLLIPVSSGFDSGLIAYRAHQLGMKPVYIGIPSCEDKDVMLRRREDLGVEFLSLSQSIYTSSLEWISTHVEDSSYTKYQPLLDIASVHQDPGTVGLFNVLRKGKELGCKVSFSGQGADEIYSDYGFQGKPLANVSSFAGRFPDDIRSILPWKNLFRGTQRAYLMKDEHVAGSLGMESRYPFLDRSLFMCFLALPSSIKNHTYKGPIGKWVSDLGIPVASNKLGFSANRNLHS
jgi:asparagine synthetase B (glutamine-hydrolysing)